MEGPNYRSLESTVFRLKNEKDGVLIGSICSKCHRVFFPQRVWCASCFEPTCEETELSREGKLISFSLIERASGYALVKPPYILGEVLLPEGPHVYTTIGMRSEPSPAGIDLRSAINEKNLSSLKMGQPVRLSPIVVKKDEEGREVVAYNFDPVEGLP